MKCVSSREQKGCFSLTCQYFNLWKDDCALVLMASYKKEILLSMKPVVRNEVSLQLKDWLDLSPNNYFRKLTSV